jgi:Tol biopolymer transport system component
MELPNTNVITVSPEANAVAVLHTGDDSLTGIWISSPIGSALKPYAPAPFATREAYNLPQARFSPDGKQILLVINRKGTEEAWVLPYPPDPSKPPRQIWKDLQSFGGTPQVSWMPDNRRVVIALAVTPGATTQLWMGDTVSGDRSALLSGTTHYVSPSVSPDGNRLIFLEGINDFDVISIALSDATPTRLIATQRYESMPAWAAREQALVYVTDRNGEYEIWLRKPGAGDRPLVTARDFPQGTTQWFMSPALSPEGDRVIYTRIERNGLARLWISSASGGAPIALTNEAGSSEFPGSWSPDGSWFAYNRIGDGKAALMKVKTSGQSAPVVLKPFRNGNGSVPAWSPSGDWIAYEDNGTTLVSPDGQNTKKLENVKARVCEFASDGKSLYCIRDDQDGSQLFSVDIGSGKERVIGQAPREFRPLVNLSPALRLSLAPDGKSAVYPTGKSSGNLWMVEGLSPKTGFFDRF